MFRNNNTSFLYEFDFLRSIWGLIHSSFVSSHSHGFVRLVKPAGTFHRKETPLPFQGGVKLMFASMPPPPLSCRRYAPKNIAPHSVSIRNFPFSSKRTRAGFAHAEIGLNWLCNINPGNVHPDVDRFRKRGKKFQDTITSKLITD